MTTGIGAKKKKKRTRIGNNPSVVEGISPPPGKENMRYIRFTGGTGYCGCDIEDYRAPDSVEDHEIDLIAEDMAHDNAESYEHVATGWGEGWESEQDEEDYYANAYCDWEEITREEYIENGGKE